jgi:hypothetical protein
MALLRSFGNGIALLHMLSAAMAPDAACSFMQVWCRADQGLRPNAPPASSPSSNDLTHTLSQHTAVSHHVPELMWPLEFLSGVVQSRFEHDAIDWSGVFFLAWP